MTQEVESTPKKGRAKKKSTELPPNPLLTLPGSKMEQLQQLYGQWYGCKKCDLCNFRAPGEQGMDVVFGDGNPNADIMIIGEAPGEEEEDSSVPFVGQSGKLLNQILSMLSDDPEIQELSEQHYKSPRTGVRGDKAIKEFHEKIFAWRQQNFFITNAIACRPPDNRTPLQEEIEKCWERLINIIYIVDPMVIVTCGSSALSAVLRKAKIPLGEMRGKVYDVAYAGKVGVVKYPVIPTYHPSYLLRKADYKQAGGDYEKTVNDWRRAFKVLDFLRNQNHGTPFPNRG